MPKQKMPKQTTLQKIQNADEAKNSEADIALFVPPAPATSPASTPIITTNTPMYKFIKALDENKASPEDIARVLADALYATDENSEPDYTSRIKAADMIFKNYQSSNNIDVGSEELTKDGYVLKALQRACDASSLKEDTKYKYFDILGKALGYVGAGSAAPVTNNTQVNISLETSKLSTEEIISNIRDMVDKRKIGGNK